MNFVQLLKLNKQHQTKSEQKPPGTVQVNTSLTTRQLSHLLDWWHVHHTKDLFRANVPPGPLVQALVLRTKGSTKKAFLHNLPVSIEFVARTPSTGVDPEFWGATPYILSFRKSPRSALDPPFQKFVQSPIRMECTYWLYCGRPFH